MTVWIVEDKHGMMMHIFSTKEKAQTYIDSLNGQLICVYEETVDEVVTELIPWEES